MSKSKTPKDSFLTNVIKGIRVPFTKPRQGSKPPKQRRPKHL